ncbi:MAG: O-methyltransferase [Eubacterium sp.]|nr:O-methyltransferase [Eubacterium sp.]
MKERVDIFLDKYRERMPDYLVELESVARSNNIPVIDRGTGDVLRYAIHTSKAKKVLEIGTAIGFSALFMREILPEDGTITTIEKIEARYSQAESNFKKHDKRQQITLLKEDAWDAIRRLHEQGEQYDLIFLDASKGQYISYLPILVDLLRVDGELITDNVFHNGVVMNSRYAVSQRDRTIHERLREYLQAITSHEQLTSLILPMEDGISISKKIK